MIGRVLPGARAVWLGALAALLIFGVVFVRDFTARTLDLSGTNSVDVATVVASASEGQRACIRDLSVPDDTGSVQVWMGLPELSRSVTVTGELVDGTRRWPVSLRTDSPAGGWRTLDLGPVQRLPTPQRGRLCLVSEGSGMNLGGSSVNLIPGAPFSDIDGKAVVGPDIGVRYVHPDGVNRVFHRIPDALQRAAIFTLIPGATWLMVLVLLALIGSVYYAVRVAALLPAAGTGDPRALARRAFVLALIGGAAWALMMPPFHGADESEHYAYAEYLAQTNHVPERAAGGTKRPYSTREEVLLGVVHHGSTIVFSGSRPRWQTQWRELGERLDKNLSEKDGGGFTESASGHAPLYYFAVGLPYRAVHSWLSPAQTEVVMRLWNAAGAALVAALAVLLAALLLPGIASAWWIAGLLVAGQPVYASVSGTINNDTGVNLLAAIAIYLAVLLWRRGPTVKTAVGLGVVAALLPIAKITGFALLPVLGVAVLIAAWAHRSRPALKVLALVPAAFVVTLGLWIVALGPIIGGERGLLVNRHPGAGLVSGGGAPVAAGPVISVTDRVDYAVQMVAPFVHLHGDKWVQKSPLYSVYVERGYGRFGWLNAGLSKGALALVSALLLGGWLMALIAAWQRRRTWRRWGPGAFVLASAILAVFAFVAYAYVTLAARSVPGEQGRYIFPAITALAVLLAAGVGALRGRWREAYLGFACGAAPLLGLLGWMSGLRDWFM